MEPDDLNVEKKKKLDILKRLRKVLRLSLIHSNGKENPSGRCLYVCG